MSAIFRHDRVTESHDLEERTLAFEHDIDIRPEERDAGPDVPVPVYAQAYVRHGALRAGYGRRYLVGVRFAEGIVPSPGWERAMRAEGVHEALLERCRRYLARDEA